MIIDFKMTEKKVPFCAVWLENDISTEVHDLWREKRDAEVPESVLAVCSTDYSGTSTSSYLVHQPGLRASATGFVKH